MTGVPYCFVADARHLNRPLLVRTASSIPEPARLILKLRNFQPFSRFPSVAARLYLLNTILVVQKCYHSGYVRYSRCSCGSSNLRLEPS